MLLVALVLESADDAIYKALQTNHVLNELEGEVVEGVTNCNLLEQLAEQDFDHSKELITTKKTDINFTYQKVLVEGKIALVNGTFPITSAPA